MTREEVIEVLTNALDGLGTAWVVDEAISAAIKLLADDTNVARSPWVKTSDRLPDNSAPTGCPSRRCRRLPMLTLRPISYTDAAQFVDDNHRHHKRPVGHKYSIGVEAHGKLVGVVMVGRPVSRYFDDGTTLEVNRLCTDGTKNACSMLYSAAWRVAQNLGYKRIVTYTLDSEPGISLRAAGWRCDGPAGGRNWTGERYRQQEMCQEMKVRWSKTILPLPEVEG